jgi:hypothetical protein
MSGLIWAADYFRRSGRKSTALACVLSKLLHWAFCHRLEAGGDSHTTCSGSSAVGPGEKVGIVCPVRAYRAGLARLESVEVVAAKLSTRLKMFAMEHESNVSSVVASTLRLAM